MIIPVVLPSWWLEVLGTTDGVAVGGATDGVGVVGTTNDVGVVGTSASAYIRTCNISYVV